MMAIIIVIFIVNLIVITNINKRRLVLKLKLAQRTIAAGRKDDENFSPVLHSEHESTINTLSQQLEKLVNVEKIYLNPDLSLIDLAHQLNTNTTYLSQVFNHHFKVNFHFFMYYFYN